MRVLPISPNFRRELYFLTMPLHAWMLTGRGTRDHYRDLRSSESWPAAELQRLQLERLRALIRHARTTTDFYKERFNESNLTENDISNLSSLERIPMLSKSDVRSNLENGLISTAFKQADLHRINTSGSTGEPFTIYANRNQLEVRFAATLRAMQSTGWDFGDPQVRLWHQTLGMSRSQVIRERIDAWFLNRTFIPAFEFSPTSISRFIRIIERKNPILIDGYAESLNFLANYLNSGKSIDVAPKAIMSSAQMLPAQTRKSIEDHLNTRVFDKYGSREFSGIAYECAENSGHHVVDECYIVEVLVDGRPAKPGEIGEVVITDLFNYATPMIRYRIGDLAMAIDQRTSCKCGRAHSRIGEIQGRTQAIVHCANGTWMPGTFFAHFFKDYEAVIRFFQIEQFSPGSFNLKIVKGEEYSDARLNAMLQALSFYVGSTSIEVQAVETIPLVRTGKRSPVISHVAVDFQSLRSVRRDDLRK